MQEPYTERPSGPGRDRDGQDGATSGGGGAAIEHSTTSTWDDIAPELIYPAVAGTSDGRARCWWAIIYPGEPSCPSWPDALERLGSLHVPMAISPEHHDINRTTGELKKMHRHLVVAYSGKKSFAQVSADLSPIGCVRIESVRDIKSAVRYLVHMDEEPFEISGKHRYDPKDLIALSGFDPEPYLAPTTSDRSSMLRDMRAWCRSEHVLDMAALIDHADAEMPAWSDLLDTDPRALRSMDVYIRGLYHRRVRLCSGIPSEL